jgi:hypothetical protein
LAVAGCGDDPSSSETSTSATTPAATTPAPTTTTTTENPATTPQSPGEGDGTGSTQAPGEGDGTGGTPAPGGSGSGGSGSGGNGSGGTPAPDPKDEPGSDSAPPPGSPAERYEHYCDTHPHACD